MEKQSFKTDKFEFLFSQADVNVNFEVKTNEGRDVTEKDETEIKQFFDDIGKWETVVDAGSNLLDGLGLREVREHPAVPHGLSRYKIVCHYKRSFSGRKDEFIYGYFELESEEGRRGLGNAQGAILKVPEILEQVRNVPKYRNLRDALVLLSSR